MMVYSYDPCPQETETRGCWEFKASLDYIASSRLATVFMRSYLKIKKTKHPTIKQMMNNYLSKINKTKKVFTSLPFSKAHLSWSLGRAVAQCTQFGADPGPAWFSFS